MEIDIAWHGPWLRFPQLLVRVEHFSAFPSSLCLAFECGRLRATPGIARNAAEALRSLKTSEDSDVEHVWTGSAQLGPAESSSVIKFRNRHVGRDTCTHASGELRFCSMEDFVFFPDSWLCCETHICLQPVFAFNGTPKRSIEFIEIGYTTVSSTEALASVFHFGQSNRFHSGFVIRFSKLPRNVQQRFSGRDCGFGMYPEHDALCVSMSSICCGQHVSALLAHKPSLRWSLWRFQFLRPTLLVASRAYVTFVFLESFLETCLHPLLRFRLDFGISRAMLWLEKVWAPWLRRHTPPHSTWNFRSRYFCLHPRWRADPSSPTSFHFPDDGIPEDRKVDWVDEWTTTHLSYCFQRVFKHFQDV